MGDKKSEELVLDPLTHSVLEEFDFKPIELKGKLDEFVIGQEQAKRVVSTAICTHYHKVKYEIANCAHDEVTPKSNILLIGPTGTGKTTILKHATRIIGMPFYETDASQYSSTGYYGKDIDDMIQGLYEFTGENQALAELGVIFIDEIDKIAISPGCNGPDVSGGSVQEELLKLLEGRVVSISPDEKKARDALEIDTKHMLFVLSGAFEGIDPLKVKNPQIGFNSENSKQKENLYKAMVEYGFMPQFLGRIPCIANLTKLTEEELCQILTLKKGDIRKGKCHEFAGFGIELDIKDSGVAALAKITAQKDIGGRGLKQTLDETLNDFLYYLPSMGVDRLSVTARLVNDPKSTLDKLIAKYPVVNREMKESGFDLEKAGQGRILRTLSERAVRDYERQLRDIGIPKRYLIEATECGLRNKFEPEFIYELVKESNSEFNEYQTKFREKWGKEIVFTRDAQTKIINVALRHDSEIEDVINACIGDYLKNPNVIKETDSKVIKITCNALEDPETYSKNLAKHSKS